jgi:hypothetical protein
MGGLLFNVENSFAQKKNSGKLKAANKRISNYTGSPIKFSRNKMYNFIGGNLSSMNYFGEMVPKSKPASTDLSFTRPNLGATMGRRIGNRYTVRASLSYGVLEGDDNRSADPTDEYAKFRYVRNLHFKNNIKEISLVTIVDLFENRGNYLRRTLFTPYIFGGVAVFAHNPKALGPIGSEYEGEWIALRPLKTEGKSYSLVQFSIPFGLGARYKLTNNFDIALELGYRYTFTDYLDDVAGNYVDPGTLTDLGRIMADRSLEETAAWTKQLRNTGVISNPIFTDQYGDHYTGYGREGDQRGAKSRDLYIVTGFNLTYIINTSGKRNAKFR